MGIGITADYGGFVLNGGLAESLRGAGYEVAALGAHDLNPA
jgi:hypothetical protein